MRCLEFPLLPAAPGEHNLTGGWEMLEKESHVPGPALLDMGDQHHRTSSTAPHLQSTLHLTEPGCDTHQGPLVPQATSCSCPTGPRQGAEHAKDTSRSPIFSPRHGQNYAAVWQLVGHTAWRPGAAVGDAGAQGLIVIPFPVKPLLQGGRRNFSRASWGAAGLRAASVPVPH